MDGRSICLESTRATAMAAHSAAGLATTAGLREAAGLLRTCEALARAAAACLASGSSASTPARPAGQAVAAPADGALAPAKARRRKQKKKESHKEPMDLGVGEAEVLSGDGGGPAFDPVPSALSANAQEFKPARVLKAQVSRERSPRRPPDDTTSSSPLTTPNGYSAASAATSSMRFAIGQAVALTGLVSRPDLSGHRATVLSFDTATSRFALRLHSTDECIRVREVNLVPSIFEASGVGS